MHVPHLMLSSHSDGVIHCLYIYQEFFFFFKSSDDTEKGFPIEDAGVGLPITRVFLDSSLDH